MSEGDARTSEGDNGTGESDDGIGESGDATRRSGDATNDGARNGTPTGLRSALLWGVVGALSFLVLIQGYELLADEAVSLGVKFGVALAVGIAAAGATHVAGSRLRPG